MGTTVTAAYLDEDSVALAHVGDSRAICFADGGAHPAHGGSFAGRGAAARRQAHRGGGARAPAALGDHASARNRADRRNRHPDLSASPGDVVLLCSDGLTSMLSEQRIQQVLVEARDLGDGGRSADRRGQRRRRARQHHRRPVPRRACVGDRAGSDQPTIISTAAAMPQSCSVREITPARQRAPAGMEGAHACGIHAAGSRRNATSACSARRSRRSRRCWSCSPWSAPAATSPAGSSTSSAPTARAPSSSTEGSPMSCLGHPPV